VQVSNERISLLMWGGGIR